MPRYYFHSADGVRLYDNEGVELADDRAAQREAIRFAGEVLKNNPEELWSNGQWRVEVTRDDHALLFTLIALAVDAPS